MITFKANVRIKTLSRCLLDILTDLEEYQRLNPEICPFEIVVTSINDSTHSENSKHYRNEAVDLRSKNFESWNKELFRAGLRDYLNLNDCNRYTVLLEGLNTANEHFHIQLSKGTSYNANDGIEQSG